MKKTILLLCLLMLSLQGYSQVTYIGRVLRDNAGPVRADWSGTMAIVRFQGRFLEMEYANSAVTWVNVWVDREPDEKAGAGL